MDGWAYYKELACAVDGADEANPQSIGPVVRTGSSGAAGIPWA